MIFRWLPTVAVLSLLVSSAPAGHSPAAHSARHPAPGFQSGRPWTYLHTADQRLAGGVNAATMGNEGQTPSGGPATGEADLPQPPPGLSLAANWHFAHPDAEMLMVVRTAGLLQSPTVHDLLERLPPALRDRVHLNEAAAQVADVNEVWISARTGDFLVLLQGRLSKFPSGFAPLGKGLSSYRLSNNAAIVGRPASVQEAVARLSHGRASILSTPPWIKDLGPDNDLWLSGTRALLAKSNRAGSPLAQDVTGFSLALSLRDGLKLRVRVDTSSPEAAGRLLAAMHKNPPSPDPSISISTRQEGASVRLALDVDRPTLAKAIDKMMASPLGQQLTAVAAGQSKGKMEIYGGTGGQQATEPNGRIEPTAPAPARSGGIIIQGAEPSH